MSSNYPLERRYEPCEGLIYVRVMDVVSYLLVQADAWESQSGVDPIVTISAANALREAARNLSVAIDK